MKLFNVILCVSLCSVAGCHRQVNDDPASSTGVDSVKNIDHNLSAGIVNLAINSIGHIELVKSNVYIGSSSTTEISQFTKAKGVPRGKLPNGYTPRTLQSNSKYHAVSARRGAETTIWVFHKNWRLIGKIAGFTEKSADIEFSWQPNANAIAVLSHTNNSTTIGKVKLQNLSYSRLTEINDNSTEMFNMAWSEESIILFYNAGGTNIVKKIDTTISPAKINQYPTLYQDTDGRGHREFEIIAPSPDGVHIAFSRFNYTSLSDEGAGIWLLNTKTGKAIEVTTESAPSFHHLCGYWKNSKVLMFYRAAKKNYDLYQIVFHKFPV